MRKQFSESEQRILPDNPNVIKVSDKSITYLPEFKVRAVKEYLSGMKPSNFF